MMKEPLAAGLFLLLSMHAGMYREFFPVSEFHNESVDDRTRKRHSTPSGVEQRFSNRNDYAASKSSPSSGKQRLGAVTQISAIIR
jgi:hypothetical protein